MTHVAIEQITPRLTYTVGGTPTTAFAIPASWGFFALTDIRVFVDGVEATYTASPTTAAQFSVTGTTVDGGYQGGTVTLGAAVSNVSVIVMRDVPIERASDFPYPSPTIDIKALNTTLDQVFAIFQQIKTLWERAIRLADGDTTTGLELPDAATRASKYLAFNGDGTAITSTGVTPPSVVTSAFGESLVGAANAAAGRTLLGAAPTDAASATVAGLVELSTDAENTTGTDTARAVTPAGLTNFAPATATIDTANDLLIVRDATDSKLKKMAAPWAVISAYTPVAQTVTAGGALTLAHGLAGAPKVIEYFIKCTDAGGEAGYVQNDEVHVSQMLTGQVVSGSGHQSGLGAKVDATNITIRFASAFNWTIPHATTGVQTTITITKWALVVRAYYWA